MWLNFVKEARTINRQLGEARISIRDNKPILDKYGVENVTDYTEEIDKENDSDLHMSISSRVLCIKDSLEMYYADRGSNIDIRAVHTYQERFL